MLFVITILLFLSMHLYIKIYLYRIPMKLPHIIFWRQQFWNQS